MEELAREDLQRAKPARERVGQSINLSSLLGLSSARQQNLLRFWLRSLNHTTPEQLHWQQITKQLFYGREDAQARVAWSNLALQRYRERLYVLPLVLPTMELQLLPSSDTTKQRLMADLPNLRVGYRTGGERCKPAGRAHSQTLKKLLQEFGLEPWLRDSVPLVFSGDELVAVGDLWICAGFVAQENEVGHGLIWRVA